MEAGFDGAFGDREDAGDVFDGEVFEEIEGQGFALEEGKLVEGVVDLLGIVEGDEGAVGCGAVGSGDWRIILGAEAKAADGVVAGGGVKKRGEGARVADRADRTEGLE